jgi:predicted DNA-binding ribbon-helix-helix protein
MWEALLEISRRERMSIHEIGTLVYNAKSYATSLTAALRVFIMGYFRKSSTEQGHTQANHGLLRLDYNSLCAESGKSRCFFRAT